MSESLVSSTSVFARSIDPRTRDIMTNEQHANAGAESKQASNVAAIDETNKLAATQTVDDTKDSLLAPNQQFTALEHNDCMELLDVYDEQVQNGEVTLYKWQIELGLLLSSKGHTNMKPLKVAVCANNGAGKDSFIIAPFAVWFILTQIKARVVITTSSGSQLTSQTEPYIKNLCDKINNFWGRKIFHVKQRYIQCVDSGSEIRMFATDEPGKAEGFHPIEPNRAFAVVANEMKSIDEEIAKALRRCNGYSHFILISSPGAKKGSFYNACINYEHSYRITSTMCKHIPDSERLEDARDFGVHSAYYRSKHEALFTSEQVSSLITDDMVNKCKELCTTHLNKSWPKRVGLDYAKGGDECVLSIWQGNKRINQITWREKDTVESAIYIDRLLRDNGIEKSSEYIRADDGGVGAGITDQLNRMGWTTIRRVHNQSPALNKRAYGNRGAEMWSTFKRILELGFWLLPYDDKKFMDQLVARHIKETQGANNRIFLETKKAERADGHPSPDRVDAAMLANIDITPEMFLDSKEAPIASNVKEHIVLNFNEYVKQHVNQAQENELNNIRPVRHQGYVNEHLLNLLNMPIKTYADDETNNEPNSSKFCNGSLMSALE